eukprot:Gb_12140 [translate_table: standard]
MPCISMETLGFCFIIRIDEAAPVTFESEGPTHQRGGSFTNHWRKFNVELGLHAREFPDEVPVSYFSAFPRPPMATDPAQRYKVTSIFEQAAAHGLTVAQTWAFNDGQYKALQTSPGVYDEQVFQALDFVVSEAQKHGQSLSSDDDFFTNPTTKGYYKNHVKGWIGEMAAHVKSIDGNHLLEAGLEAIAVTTVGSKIQLEKSPRPKLSGSDEQTQLSFLDSWIQTHLENASTILKKPVLFAEFGKSSKYPCFQMYQRDNLLSTVYKNMYSSPSTGGASRGGLVWQKEWIHSKMVTILFCLKTQLQQRCYFHSISETV